MASIRSQAQTYRENKTKVTVRFESTNADRLTCYGAHCSKDRSVSSSLCGKEGPLDRFGRLGSGINWHERGRDQQLRRYGEVSGWWRGRVEEPVQ